MNKSNGMSHFHLNACYFLLLNKIKTAFHGVLLEAILHYCCKSSSSLNMFDNQIDSGYWMVNSSTFFFLGLKSGLEFIRCLATFLGKLSPCCRKRVYFDGVDFLLSPIIKAWHRWTAWQGGHLCSSAYSLAILGTENAHDDAICVPNGSVCTRIR